MAKNKIMIVDDEHISLAMTEHILSSAYEVVCATSGEDAIRLYPKENPDMILSDLRMPGMSGFDLQKKLQKTSAHNIPFMFMTADPDENIESQGLEEGAMDFIRKPFRADVLLSRVANILQTVDQIQGLKKAAETDPMTGLMNKVSVHAEINSMCRHSRGVLMMIDLDSFKPVNDIYGHDMGDKILIRFAEIICSAIRGTDIAGRLGGDEFIVFCQNVTDEAVIAEKTRYINEHIVESAIEFMGDDMNIPIGASIGCSVAPKDGTDFHTLYKKADKALYSVKQHGKHGFAIYKESGGEESHNEVDATDIGSAITLLAERNPAKGAMVLPMEQFKLIYQFLVRVNSNYQKRIHVVQFTIMSKSKNSDGIPSSDAISSFLDVMGASLRQSDVITQSAKNKFLVILLKTVPLNAQLVIDRIMEHWSQNQKSLATDVTYEMREME